MENEDRQIKELAEKIHQKQKQIIKLAKKTDSLTKKDIATWRRAWQQAINVENPKRVQLYDIYTDCLIDNHLSGAIDQRKNFVKKKSFKIINIKDKKEMPEVSELFETHWFKDFINFVLDSKFWGHSLIEFGDVIDRKTFANINIVPRKHVIPEFGVILYDYNDDVKTGIDYRNSDLIKNWIIEVGGNEDLGLLLKVAPQAIAKRGVISYWDTFSQLFGMPLRIATTKSNDQAEINSIQSYLEQMGSACWGIFPDSTEIQLISNTNSDSFNVYDKRIDRANSEISKAILNQTMTIDSGSSYSQADVHLQIFQNVIDADADFVRDTVNDKLIPLMESHGFPVANCRFEWDENIDYTPEQQLAIENMLLGYFEIDDTLAKFFAEKYNIPVSKAKQLTPSLFRDDSPDSFFA